MLRNALRKTVPSPIQRKLFEFLVYLSGGTVAQGWEQYAQAYEGSEGEHLGDEWNEPDVLGVDVPAEQIVSYLDERVFGPFLGTCEVLLEIGPGGGRLTEVLLPKCQRLIAADTAPSMLKLLRERFAGSSNIDYVLLDGRGLSSIPDASVDAAVSYDVFVHLQHWDIFNYLSELARVLRPGGKAVIHHANTFSDLGWKRFLRDLPISLNMHKLRGTFSPMTPEMMKEFVERAGLRLDECVTDVVRRDCLSLVSRPDR